MKNHITIDVDKFVIQLNESLLPPHVIKFIHSVIDKSEVHILKENEIPEPAGHGVGFGPYLVKCNLPEPDVKGVYPPCVENQVHCADCQKLEQKVKKIEGIVNNGFWKKTLEVDSEYLHEVPGLVERVKRIEDALKKRCQVFRRLA